MKAELVRTEHLQSDIFSIFFSKPARFRFTAGQFTEIVLPHDNADDRGIKRWFTISSSPSDELIAITTRFASEHGSSFKKALRSLQPGDTVDLAEAMGDFVLPKSPNVPVVLVAGGIGITPVHSMLSWLAQEHETRNIHLLWSVRSEDDIIFQDTFRAAGVHATIVVSEPSDSWGGERGQLTAAKILGLEKPSDETLFYLSGPEPMLEALTQDLQSHAVSARQIVTDFFPGYREL
jgi:ferredoxin-NADP reductase